MGTTSSSSSVDSATSYEKTNAQRTCTSLSLRSNFIRSCKILFGHDDLQAACSFWIDPSFGHSRLQFQIIQLESFYAPQLLHFSIDEDGYRKNNNVKTRVLWNGFDIEVYTPALKKLQIHFCQNFVKFSPILIIFGRKTAKSSSLCKMHSFSTSLNSRHTTVLNADIRNCYTTLKVVICSKLASDLNSTSKVKCGLFSRIRSSNNSSVQNCQNLCSKYAPRTRTQALRRRRHRKRASRFLWRGACTFSVASSHLRLHRNMSLYKVEGVKCAIVCYF